MNNQRKKSKGTIRHDKATHGPTIKEKPGPKPQYLKIEGDWRDAVKLAVQKKKPANGWPK
jgi:hypothetical protein